MKHTVKILNDTIIVEDLVSAVTDYEYSVVNGACLTVVFRSLTPAVLDVHARIRLASPGSSAKILGIIVAGGESDIRLHTMQEHEAPDTTSNLLIKTALYDAARCTIDGGIRVEKDAQKTDAYQRNENLLMSPHAHAESKPSLEILANDVRCTHGATMGPVSEEELWYMATRGIQKSEAEPLIVAGFFRKEIDLIDDAGIREHMWKSLEEAI